MSAINFQRTYPLDKDFKEIKGRTNQFLAKYLKYPGLISFDDQNKSVTFSSERLVPGAFTGRPRVLLLFSNPHPLSIQQGMFLSPNTRGRENLFWPVMIDAGWITIAKEKRDPRQLVEICLGANYPGPYDLIFYCYYAFPSDSPEDISRIFGKDYFQKVIEPEAADEFRNIVQELSVRAVVTFNKGIYNHISKGPIDRSLEWLITGKLIKSDLKDISQKTPVFLTFPTGWRYNKQYRELRKNSLLLIKDSICRDNPR